MFYKHIFSFNVIVQAPILKSGKIVGACIARPCSKAFTNNIYHFPNYMDY